eukprot:358057-Chlamydomonas_euryale.AAC.4
MLNPASCTVPCKASKQTQNSASAWHFPIHKQLSAARAAHACQAFHGRCAATTWAADPVAGATTGTPECREVNRDIWRVICTTNQLCCPGGPFGVFVSGKRTLCKTQHASTTEGGIEGQSQSYRERTHEGYARVERSKTEGIKQRVGRCHKGHAIAHGIEPPHTNPTPPTGT